jgi:hypothetical protein
VWTSVIWVWEFEFGFSNIKQKIWFDEKGNGNCWFHCTICYTNIQLTSNNQNKWTTQKTQKPLSFTHAIALWRFESSLNFHLPSGSCLRNARVHSLTLSYTPENMGCDSWASSWLTTLQPFCLGCEPKVRVATSCFSFELSCYVKSWAICYWLCEGVLEIY